MDKKTKVICLFLDILLRDYNNWDTINNHIKDDEFNAETLNPIITRWINEGVEWDNKKEEERIKKEWEPKAKKIYRSLRKDRDFGRLWLQRWPKFITNANINEAKESK